MIQADGDVTAIVWSICCECLTFRENTTSQGRHDIELEQGDTKSHQQVITGLVIYVSYWINPSNHIVNLF